MKRKTVVKLTRFDIAEQLKEPEDAAEYLSQVLADGDDAELLRALGHIARARGIAKVAEESGLGRESLYKALSPGAKPRYDTVLKVARAVGVRLSASAAWAAGRVTPVSARRLTLDRASNPKAAKTPFPKKG